MSWLFIVCNLVNLCVYNYLFTFDYYNPPKNSIKCPPMRDTIFCKTYPIDHLQNFDDFMCTINVLAKMYNHNNYT